MRLTLCLCLSLLLGLKTAAVETQTAVGAVKVLPKDAAQKLARIEARDGAPNPQRWHLLVHNAETENGFREYVVAGNEIVTTHEVSQFAETVKPEEVIGDGVVKIDSDRVAKLAQQYAVANNASIASMNYELRKQGPEATAVWKVTCLDEKGTEVGSLAVTAGQGQVVSRTGFPLEPQTAAQAPKVNPETQRQVAMASPPQQERRSVHGPKAEDAPPIQEKPQASTEKRRGEARRTKPLDAEAQRPPVEDAPPIQEKPQAAAEKRRGEVRRTKPVDAEAQRPPVEVRRAERVEPEPQPTPGVARRVTEPVRRIVRGLLPF